MDFYEILAQVIKLLQREGRVTYRALKRQFNLDDEFLEDIKAEIIEAKQLAVDENDSILVWTGGVGTQPESTSTKPVQQEFTQESQLTQAEPLPPEPPTPDAERRQLTVMFIDIVESTSLSSQLDPEDLREVVREYQKVCSEVIQRYDGHVAQLLGDGLLVYFGYPQAHEDDAQRAVRAGLGIIEAIGALNTRLASDQGIKLAVRLGIHTGLVVVGEMGGAGRQEQLALGEVPNVAARIQGLAEPDTVVVSDATFHLVEGYFTCQALGTHMLKGVTDSVHVYRVLQESGAQSRLEIVTTRGLTPLVGRESEVTLLLDRWEQVKDGQGQVVLLSGEGGIGKSRLVQVLKDHVAEEVHTQLECRSSSYFQNSALYPITDLFQRTLQWQPDDTPEERLVKLERVLGQSRLPLEETVPLFATILSIPTPEDRYPSLNWSLQRQRQKTMESIVAMLLELTERQPVLFILEDLHWTDPSTLELLDLLIDQTPTASIYTLLTYRPEFQLQWSNRSYLTQVTLHRLSRTQIAGMAARVADGKKLPDEVLQQIIEKTDGVPLFVEEMTKAVLESGTLKEIDGQYKMVGSLASLAIPATLQDSLMARLDRLVTAKAVAQYAAVIGRQFSYALLQAVSQLDEATLYQELGRLVEAELVYQRGLPPQATYLFKHALVQDAAYQSLLKRTRQQVHQRIAQVLAERLPETSETQPELLAHHYTEAGLTEQAVDYWQQAGDKATQRLANQEAISHFTKGLDLLITLPAVFQRNRQELDILIMMGPAVVAAKGVAASEAEQVYTRARELCHQVGETGQLLGILERLSALYAVRGELQIAVEMGQELLSLAGGQEDPTWHISGYSLLGQALTRLGEFDKARTNFEQAIGLYRQHRPSGSAWMLGVNTALAQLPLVLWHLGYPDQALGRSGESLIFAREMANPFRLVIAQQFAAGVHVYRREPDAACELAQTVITEATEHGFAQWIAAGNSGRGYALTAKGQMEEGITLLQQSLSALQATGSEYMRANFCLPWLAEAYGKVGQSDAGLRLLTEAQTLAQEVREFTAERNRLRGILLLQQNIPDEQQAETCFQQALSIARHQQAKSWELRAAASLARLWQSQDKRQDAYDLLAPVYGWFTEGFDTADLQEAKALLEELRS